MSEVKFKQGNRLRRLIKNLDPNIRRRVRASIRWSARELHRDAIAFALAKDVKDTGAMIASISKNFSSDKLSAHIGPGADRAYVRKNPFSNTLLNKGLLAKSMPLPGNIGRVKLVPGRKFIRDSEARFNFMKGYWHEFGTSAVEPMPPHPLPPRPFMNESWDKNKVLVSKVISDSVTRALKESVRRG